jgi:hypothetical protein
MGQLLCPAMTLLEITLSSYAYLHVETQFHAVSVLHAKYHVQPMTVAGVDTLSSFGLKIMDDHMGF